MSDKILLMVDDVASIAFWGRQLVLAASSNHRHSAVPVDVRVVLPRIEWNYFKSQNNSDELPDILEDFLDSPAAAGTIACVIDCNLGTHAQQPLTRSLSLYRCAINGEPPFRSFFSKLPIALATANPDIAQLRELVGAAPLYLKGRIASDIAAWLSPALG